MRVALSSFLLAAVLAAAGAAPASASSACLDLVGVRACVKTPGAFPKNDTACAGRDDTITEANLASARRATLCLLNVERARAGLTPLQGTPSLRRAATAFSKRMVRDRFFAHVGPSGDTMTQRIKRTSYLTGARNWSLGENIAFGGGALSTPAKIVDRWMGSPPHRVNILDGAFRHIGIGIAPGTPEGGDGGTYTTEFGSRR